jgi:hypothetical protein
MSCLRQDPVWGAGPASLTTLRLLWSHRLINLFGLCLSVAPMAPLARIDVRPSPNAPALRLALPALLVLPVGLLLLPGSSRCGALANA